MPANNYLRSSGGGGGTGATGSTGPAGPAGATGATGATGAPGTGTLTFTQVEVDFGTRGHRSGKFTIAGAGMTIGKPVLIHQARVSYTGKGTLADEADMDTIVVIGTVTSAVLITCSWQSRTWVRGNFKFDYVIGA
jgi:hypothetical protein